MRRDNRTSLQEYASHVSRLTNLANPELPEEYRSNMTLRTFKSTIGHVGLQRHLLAANVQTLEEAVRVGSEYLQIGAQAAPRHDSRVAVCDTDDLDNIQVKPVISDTRRRMLDMLSKLSERMDQIESSVKKKDPPTCFGCGKAGHFRSNCPQKKQGNGNGPRN